MKRILVIGSGGAGKTTFAKRLSKILMIEVIHLDSLYWKSGWIEPPKDEWKQTVEQLIAPECWIMDGNYSGTLDVRIEACDTVIFLDFAQTICEWRVIKRSIKYRNKSRPDMAEGCPEKIDLKFMLWVWNYQKRTKPKVVRMLTDKPDKTVIFLRTDAELEEFLARIKDA